MIGVLQVLQSTSLVQCTRGGMTKSLSTDCPERASLRRQIYALQIRARSPIPARPFRFALSRLPPDEPNSLQMDGCAVDGGLARPDADHDGRGTRDHARAQRFSDHGGALDPGLLPAVPADPR